MGVYFPSQPDRPIVCKVHQIKLVDSSVYEDASGAFLTTFPELIYKGDMDIDNKDSSLNIHKGQLD